MEIPQSITLWKVSPSLPAKKTENASTCPLTKSVNKRNIVTNKDRSISTKVTIVLVSM